MHATVIVYVTTIVFGISSGALAAQKTAIPRAPDGHPNLEGTWANMTLTPFERPAGLGTKTFYSPEELAAAEARERARMSKVYRPEEGVGTDNEAFFEEDRHWLPTRQTSLVIDPPDGHVPLRSELLALSDAHSHTYNSYETMSPQERCLSPATTGLFPKMINSSYQFAQTHDHLLVHAEFMDDVRVIPLQPRARPDERVTEWSGISRGHWEGDTLVVETTNFNDHGRIQSSVSQGAVRNFPQTRHLKTIERFTLTAPDTIDYRITFDDPTIFTAPWTVSFPFTRASDYKLYEFACHEGNIDMEITLRGARVEEKNAEKNNH